MKKFTHIRFHVSEKTYSQYAINKYDGGLSPNCTEYKDFYEINHCNFLTGNLICQMRADKKTLEVTANTVENPNEFKSLKEFGWFVTLYNAETGFTSREEAMA